MFFKKVIQDLNPGSILQEFDKTSVRRSFEVLFVDDDGEFETVEFIRNHNFNIHFKKDIENTKDVAGYDIILCDIRGVGSKFHSKYEGAYVIKEIKASYPRKIVIAYTASTYDPNYNSYLELADKVISKGKDVDEWVAVLDNAIAISLDPIYQWKKVRDELLKNDVSISVVRNLEDKYVKSILRKDFTNFEKLAQTSINEKSVINIIEGLLKSPLFNLITKGIDNG